MLFRYTESCDILPLGFVVGKACLVAMFFLKLLSIFFFFICVCSVKCSFEIIVFIVLNEMLCFSGAEFCEGGAIPVMSTIGKVCSLLILYLFRTFVTHFQ